MDLVLCHTTADFDTLGAAVGLTRNLPGSRIVLAGGSHPTVGKFLALHRDEYPLLERRAVDLAQVRSLTVVDTQQRQRLGPLAEWLDWAVERQIPIYLYDHHTDTESDIPATERVRGPVGAATTLVVELLQQHGISLSRPEATVMALGIHVDTGSLVFEQATARDALALAWLMEQGASQSAIAEFVEPSLSPQQQQLLSDALETLETETVRGFVVGSVLLTTESYTPGLSAIAERLISWSDCDCLLFGATYHQTPTTHKLVLIGRARGRAALPRNSSQGVDFNALLTAVGGGGHRMAAAATLTTEDPTGVMAGIMDQLRLQIPHPPVAQDLMSAPVRTIRPDTTIQQAQRVLLRYGHSGLSVVSAAAELQGIISRRDLDLALHHGFSHAPVKGYMTTQVKTIDPQTPLPQIEALMVTYDIGRLPVLDQGRLVGIVTRTDVLRQLHQDQLNEGLEDSMSPPAMALPQLPSPDWLLTQLSDRLPQALWEVLQQMAAAAQAQGWHLYLVGGAVRDLLLATEGRPVSLKDLDLVVDGCSQVAQVGAGMELATAIAAQDHAVDLQVHGQFQTAALIWHHDAPGDLAGLMVDVATARTEFYPYPAANPEVEASSIRQDLYRRDFSINALAMRLTSPGAGTLMDFFGGLVDLRQRTIRVLHANSFIEDPTRIYRAVRFAVRLGFTLDDQTQGYIHHAIDSGIYTQMQQQMTRVPALQTRLKNELKYILEAPYWQQALGLLDKLRALQCLHPALALEERLWHQMRRMGRWLERFDPQQQLVPWQMRLEVLLATLPETDRATVAMALQLPATSIERLAQIGSLERDWTVHLTPDQPPSALAAALRQQDLGTLLLISVRHPRPLGRLIWRYLTHWQQIQAPLNGHDLKRLGYRPGPAYRDMLEALLGATLDGDINSPETAEAFLAEHFPLGYQA